MEGILRFREKGLPYNKFFINYVRVLNSRPIRFSHQYFLNSYHKYPFWFLSFLSLLWFLPFSKDPHCAQYYQALYNFSH